MRRLAFSMCRSVILCACLWLLCFAEANAAGSPDRFPAPEVNPVLAAPITTWDEAIPLGNGLLGGLLWGEKDVLRLSLDRGDLWDERPAVEKEWWKKSTYALMQQLVREGRHDEVNRLYDAPYNGVSPTKLPAGRLEITLAAGQKLDQFELSLRTAEGLAHLTSSPPISVFFAAQTHVAMVRIPGAEPKTIRLLSPLDVHRRTKNGDAGPSSGGSVDRLGYPEAQRGQDGRTQWYVQEAAEGLSYCVCVDSTRDKDGTVLAVTVTSTQDSADPLQLARQRCAAALRTGFDAMKKPHLAWWENFWAQSAVRVPDIEIQRQYCLVQYFYGAASRRGAPPMPLQGVWTADSGGLPPWKGDYHNDLNTQMTYIAYQAAGHFDEGASFLDMLWDLLPKFRDFARDFYGTPGAAVPGVMSLAGQPLGGWGQYSLSPTMGAWNAHLFYLHWRYTGDDTFLRTRAYPWCQEVGQSLRALLKPNDRGLLVLPLSTSPEIYDNTGRAWLEPNSNYDLACLKMLFLSLAEMADACGKPADARDWSATAAALGDFHVNADELLLIDARQPLPYSHRHLSNLMGLFPFNLTTPEGGPRDQKRIGASLAQWDQLGPSQWCGYSYSWMSCLRARVGDAESALRHLDIFVKAFVLRNGFHANGDQTKSGFSSMTYRPFTLEGNFLAAQAVQEMLLQSWSPTPGQRDTEILRIFPATPWRWHAVAFDNLRAEGGHRVSARRENNATTWLEIVAGKDGPIRIRDNFGQRTPQWNRTDVKKVGEEFEVVLKQGESLSAKIALWATSAGQAADGSAEAPRLSQPFPRVAMLWASIRGDNSNEAMARHDLVLVGPGTLGLKYDRQPSGLADGFTPESVRVARERVERIRQLNPGVIILGEVLFYEWPDRWLPEDHPWWLRKNGQRQQFWPGTHRMNWDDPEYRRQVVRQTMSLQSAGLDGVFYDNLREEPEPWVNFLREVRQQVGDHFLILANCGYSVGKHDFAAPFLNGFMYESGWSHGRTGEWTELIRKMQHSESLLRSPRISLIERFEEIRDQAGWPGDTRRGQKPAADPGARRWSLAFALVVGDFFYLFSDNTSHRHDWYPEYDVKIGQPLGPGEQVNAYAWTRKYEKAVVAVNLPGAKADMTLNLEHPAKDSLTGEEGRSFVIPPGDGRILVRKSN